MVARKIERHALFFSFFLPLSFFKLWIVPALISPFDMEILIANPAMSLSHSGSLASLEADTEMKFEAILIVSSKDSTSGKAVKLWLLLCRAC